MPQNEVIALPQRQAVAMSFSDIEKLAEAVAHSRLFGITTKEQAIVLMSIAAAEGRHPVEAARDYNIIQNRPAKTAEAMMRDLIAAGGKVEWHQLTDDIADATFSHPSGGKMRIIWDMKRAATAGLSSKEMWKKYPRQMLRSRCVSEGVKTVCPMATSGMYTPEEVRDMPAAQLPEPISAAADLDRFAEVSDQRLEEEGYPGSLVPPRHEPAVTNEDPFGLPPLPIRNEKPSPRRSAIWQEENYRVTATALLDGTPDWEKWASDIEFLVTEASSEELRKLLIDNKELLSELRRTRGDRYRDITIATATRRDELHAKGPDQ
jgi:hypothetical protein